ncbi:DUF6441 family protein [Sphingomonas morindae]|uniref:DUF6441 family protein n=1 Tax=Sphingomonas morindae TaxID=1541170 RepID=A0ABY4X413_9SPHN|nr:DUF6441 family protein [Sphingomonas morindae]USI71614.1 DUF6441 family protein [Sphingomonas morindae]
MAVADRVDVGLDIDFDPVSIAGSEDAVVRKVLLAASRAVQRVTRNLELDLEAVTRAAVPGKLWRAWTSEIAPKPGLIAREPTGWVRLNSRRQIDGMASRTYGAMDFFSSPGTLRGRRGQYLAIPTKAAGSRGRYRNLTPSEWERMTGKELRLVTSQERGGAGRAGLLVADEGTTNARTGAFRPITRGRTAADLKRGYQRGVQTVVIFVLVRQVQFADTFSTEPSLRRAEQALAAEFAQLLATLEGNDGGQ